MNEWARIDVLQKLFGRKRPHAKAALSTLLGVGDDAAILSQSGAQSVLATSDSCVENVHFERHWIGAPISLSDLIVHACGAAISDIHAMGGLATSILSTLTLPDWVERSQFESVTQGYLAVEKLYGVELVGGNLSSGRELTLSHTVLGVVDKAVSRHGARVGDGVYVTGPIGDAALAVAAMKAGRGDEFSEAVTTWRMPPNRSDVARKLADIAHAAIDISDGLVSDLIHLLRASGAGAALELSLIPRASNFSRDAHALGLSEEQILLAGGEDYELIFVSSDQRASEIATKIGTITDDPVVRIVGASDREWRGHTHF